MSRFRMPRRTLLRGAGVALGLPLLEPMLAPRGRVWGRSAAAAEAPPVHFLAFNTPMGVFSETALPDEPGPTYTTPPALAPIDRWKPQITLLSGLRRWDQHNAINNLVSPGDAHGAEGASFLTGCAMKSGAQAGGPSIDQLLAARWQGKAVFDSLAVAAGKAGSVFHSTLSWDLGGRPVTAERSVPNLYNRLFGGPASAGNGVAARLAASRRSVLDHLRDELARLGARVGAEDRARIDAHLSAVREMERQLAAPVAGRCAGPAAPQTDALDPNGNELVRLQLDLLAYAFTCDLTRVATFQLFPSVNGRKYPWVSYQAADGKQYPIDIGHHTLTHGSKVTGAELVSAKTNIEIDRVSLLAHLLGRLSAARTARGTLLDDSLVFYGSVMAQNGPTAKGGGNKWEPHDAANAIVLLAGGAGGTHRGGRYLPFGARKLSYSNVLVNVLNLLGDPATSVGTYGTEALPGVS